MEENDSRDLLKPVPDDHPIYRGGILISTIPSRRETNPKDADAPFIPAASSGTGEEGHDLED